ncbi:GntR family transcriptional regulator [Dactylosporangium sp. NPDC051485]|uniref:GntR family transcriptional regulator n=1 Tax=Dactylosporangium sp. NPDC051485 TaxID=3154846 RepID=UPI00343EE2B9
MPSSKYTEIFTVLQRRIDAKQYEIGDYLPTEAELTREFGTSRATVVRALRQLRLRGWIQGVQGKGRIVLGRPATRFAQLPERVKHLLLTGEDAALQGVRLVSAPARIAAVLGRAPGVPLLSGRYVLAPPDAPPFGLRTVFVPANLTNLTTLDPEGGLLAHLERRNGIAAGRVIERVGARLATGGEAAALRLPEPRSVAVSLITVLDVRSDPLLAVDAVLAREAPAMLSTYDL